MKKIIYICNTRFPTEKAHGISTVKLCEAFAEQGYQVDLIVPRLWRKSNQDLFTHYNVKRIFNVRKILCIDLLGLFFIPSMEKFTFLLQILSFSAGSIFYVLKNYTKKERDSAIFMSHDYIPLSVASLISSRIFYDIHHFPGENFMYRRIMERSFGFAVQTKWKISGLEKDYGVNPTKIVYWPNGTDVDKFNKPISIQDARKKLGLPPNIFIAVYTGQLFGWKGVDTFIRSISYLGENFLFYIVGGSVYDTNLVKSEINEANDRRICFVSPQPHDQMIWWQKAANILVLPNTGKQKVSMYYTSPMKLFEYMASDRPIVASSIPSIREILNEENSVLVSPDDPKSLADGIKSIADDPDIGVSLAKQALKDVQQYTWHERARKIIKYFNENI